MRRAWIVGCLLLLAACSKKETASAVDLSVQYKGYVPKCLRVTVADAKAPEANTSSDTLKEDKLVEHSDPKDRTVRIAVFREKGWSQELKIDVASYSTADCGGTPVETRGLASVTLPAKGLVTPEPIVLKARDTDGDGYIAESDDSAIQQDTDCNDTASNIHPGAKRECGLTPDPDGDFNCDKLPECAQKLNGEACQGGTMCKSGFCVAGICCNNACNSPGTCRGAGSCGTGTCNYPIVAGQACSDGNGCTTNDTCNAQGSCVPGAAVVCNNRPGQCFKTTGTCNTADGGCDYAPLGAGTACNDNSPCSFSDSCNGSGACVGTPKVCNTPGAGNQCSASLGTCIEADGGCTYPNLDAGTPCNDSNSCTHSDQCNAGACESTPYACTGGNDCQLNGATACAGDGGCLYSPNPAKDGQVCNLGSSQSGTCLPGTGKCSAFPYVPSNFDPDALSAAQIANLPTVTLSCDTTTFDSTTLSWSVSAGCTETPPSPPTRLHQSAPGAPFAVIVSMKQLDINSGKTLRLVGERPVILAVYGNATLNGKVLANAVKDVPGAGGNGGSCGSRVGSPGLVGSGEATFGGGGGGGFGTVGGNGGRGETTASTGGPGGAAVGSTYALVPLYGGCQGGNGGRVNTTLAVGGAGGGALQISVAGTLQVLDTVSVSGGGGMGGKATTTEAGGGGGGGSGGGLHFEAATLSVGALAELTAQGGGGGQGGRLAGGSAPGEDGTDGPTDSFLQATGGDSGSGGAHGGTGSATGGSANGDNGTGVNGGGGGGGAAGRIRLYGKTSCTITTTTVSPTALRGGDC
ncbi:hypothetical protein [Archangium sp.]|jgi:hypothetical protein|uniref:hypothetical protein n=1 Tax=Archangium sp. TaxID=1872627 RepID=UPI002ED9D4B0